MNRPQPLSARAIGIGAAVITVIIWSSFIVIARASADPARGGTLDPFDIALARLLGAGAVLLPVGWWLVRRDRALGVGESSLSEVAFQMLFQGLGSVVISGTTFTRMIQHFGPVRSTMITALVPGLSAMCAVFFLGEPLHWNLSLGLALVTLGILFGVRSVAAPVLPKAVAIAPRPGARGPLP